MALSPLPENVLPAGADTVLTISRLGVLQYQARGLAQTFGIIPQAKQQARTINAAMRDISNHAFRKYTTEITCTDINAPPLDGLFPGDIVTMHCAAVLCYPTGNPGSPNRSPVSGSEWTLGHMNFYRPILEVMISDVTQNFEEWKSDFIWKIAGEEV